MVFKTHLSKNLFVMTQRHHLPLFQLFPMWTPILYTYHAQVIYALLLIH